MGIAAAAALAALADWVDLDGNLLLADDPFDGLELGDDCRWQPADRRPGWGSARRGAAEPVLGRRVRRAGGLWTSSWTKSVDEPPSAPRAARAYASPSTQSGAGRTTPGRDPASHRGVTDRRAGASSSA